MIEEIVVEIQIVLVVGFRHLGPRVGAVAAAAAAAAAAAGAAGAAGNPENRCAETDDTQPTEMDVSFVTLGIAPRRGAVVEPGRAKVRRRGPTSASGAWATTGRSHAPLIQAGGRTPYQPPPPRPRGPRRGRSAGERATGRSRVGWGGPWGTRDSQRVTYYPVGVEIGMVMTGWVRRVR